MSRWRGNPWVVLLTLSLGFFMTLLDMTVVNVAIPSMIAKLHASLDEMLWVINIYVLVLAALLIASGRLGDVRGPRTMFIGGIVVFTVASVLCGLSQDPAQLIAARAVQGLGAAALVPQTMTIIIGTFPAERRGAALGVWGAVAGVATIAGPTLGGFLISTVGWRWIFFVNVPIAVVVVVMAVTLVPDVRHGARRRLDMPGVVLATATLCCLTFGLTEGQRYDWNAGIWALLGGAALLLVVFLIYQGTRQHNEPLLPFALFRDRNYAVMNFVSATVQVGMLGLFLPVMIYLQSVLNFSALKAGLVMAPAMVVSAVLSPVAGRMADRIGGKYILMTGLTLFAAGMAWLASVIDVGRTWYAFQPALIVAGLGIGCVFGPMVTVAMYNVRPGMAGAASGVLNTIRQIGTVIGSATVGAVLQNRLAAALRDEAAKRAAGLPASVRGKFVAGFDNAGRGGLDVGAGQTGAALKPPQGTPASLTHHVRQVAAATFQHGFVHAMRPSLALPIAVIAVGAVSCTLVRRRPADTPPERSGYRRHRRLGHCQLRRPRGAAGLDQRTPAMNEPATTAPETASAMAAAAADFLAALTDVQRDKAGFDFADEAKRRDWSFLPAMQRDGLPIGALDDTQRKLAHELIVSGTSMPGYAKVVSVIAMEHVLRALTAVERPAGADLFDPGRFSFKVFGRPGDTGAWGWQFAGHHVSLNFTVVDGRYVSPTPSFLGSEPATFGTLAPLADDEEAGYRFVNSLDPAQRAAAIIHHRSPPDLATRIVPRIGQVERPDPVFAPEPDYVLSEAERDILGYVRGDPKGVGGHELREHQRSALFAIVEAFAGRLPSDVAAAQLDDIEQAGVANLAFAWAGGTSPGDRHYFRIQGPVLLIEHDNTQADGTHIHSVWRNPADDFGDDVLAEHYRRHH